MTFQNIGTQISDFVGTTNTSIPFDVKLGTSFKPEYMPLRFTMTTTNLVNQILMRKKRTLADQILE